MGEQERKRNALLAKEAALRAELEALEREEALPGPMVLALQAREDKAQVKHMGGAWGGTGHGWGMGWHRAWVGDVAIRWNQIVPAYSDAIKRARSPTLLHSPPVQEGGGPVYGT